MNNNVSEGKVRTGEEWKIRRSTVLTPRVILILFALTFAVVWVNLGAHGWGAGYIAGIYEPNRVPNLFAILVLFILSLLVIKGRPIAKVLRLDLSRGELVAIYIGVGFMSLILSWGMMFQVIAHIGVAPFEYQMNPTLFGNLEAISPSMYVWEEQALDDIQFGLAAVPWSLWIVPLLLWSLLFIAMFFLLFCLGAMFYHRWSMEEKLAFPLVTPVVRMVDCIEGGNVDYSFRNKIFVIGVAIPVFIRGLDILRQFSPLIPSIVMHWNVANFVGSGPLYETLNAAPGTSISIIPYVVGIGYLLPTDFGFSIWFFHYIVNRTLLNYFLYSAGLSIQWGQYSEFQFQGGYIILALFLVYLSRTSLKNYLKAAFDKNCNFETEKMPINPKIIVFGGLISIVFLTVAGYLLLSIHPIFMLINIFLLLCLALVHARCRTEVGMPFSGVSLYSGQALTRWFGSSAIGNENIVGLRMISSSTAWHYPTSSAWAMEGLKLGDESGVSRNNMIKIFGVVTIMIFLIGGPLILRGFYDHGLAIVIGPHVYNHSLNLARPVAPEGISPARYGLLFAIIGGIFTLIFAAMRSQFVWWPFHPLGYLLGMQLDFGYRFPGSFLVAWIIKVTVLRYTSGDMYNKLKPLFVGLIISDILMKTLWTVVATGQMWRYFM